MVDLQNYLSEDLVCLNLESRSREGLFEEMVGHLVEGGQIADGERAIELLADRERLSSTGMRGGFALPHAYLKQVERSLLMVGVSHHGIRFDSLESEPVFVVFLLLGSGLQLLTRRVKEVILGATAD